ncbi:LacI family transcriptional regulator [Alkalihalobacillus sp. MEB130]|uniref:LacI family DNA-binding transcriptional regulator n=1 Tax=Alkalihalobacillus sp. MEB130 TaxID=2976704 RepID=UPI0028DFA6C7|nr:LacI family DNA-binding transcriptional regulator [Alkalihalobacillus sp. MEB130]MDT8859231.1 LacI family transcriptional regulator [Alkalihalobacillus sp. MEB130]
MATIEDVAKLAGLSRSTVSRVINNHPYVTEKKKQLVYEAMKELDFFPNSSAQRLRKQKTDTIAVLVPSLTNPFFPFLIEGLENVAVENGLQLLICQTHQNKDKERNYLQLLQTKQVDGVILTSLENDWHSIAPFKESGPIIMCNEYRSEASIPVVRLNQIKGSYLGAKHLIEHGHKKIAYCGNDKGELGADRQKGFRAALVENNIEISEQWIFRDDPSIENGKRILKAILALEDKPTAIFAGSDEVAAGIIKEAKLHGLTIPHDLAVLGFDDLPIAQLVEPSLTTVRQPIKEMGQKTMEVMVSRLASQDQEENTVIELPIELIVRDSV